MQNRAAYISHSYNPLSSCHHASATLGSLLGSACSSHHPDIQRNQWQSLKQGFSKCNRKSEIWVGGSKHRLLGPTPGPPDGGSGLEISVFNRSQAMPPGTIL